MLILMAVAQAASPVALHAGAGGGQGRCEDCAAACHHNNLSSLPDSFEPAAGHLPNRPPRSGTRARAPTPPAPQPTHPASRPHCQLDKPYSPSEGSQLALLTQGGVHKAGGAEL